jgi:hypothetical protein
VAESSKIVNELRENKPSSVERNEQLMKELAHNYSPLEDGAKSIGRNSLNYQKRSEFSYGLKKGHSFPPKNYLPSQTLN